MCSGLRESQKRSGLAAQSVLALQYGGRPRQTQYITLVSALGLFSVQRIERVQRTAYWACLVYSLLRMSVY